ncbi:insulin-like growth factor-binding protein complex acid labile subunit isoform X2 [Cylas formicarius]|uniref:insulin-like growth factor-binding protein complex acid labile subunit isoform X2 n=1 Tax=Cylas formicarius TaxID=197179 RepID=UPI0029587DCD|nr:insulin-like growth factor-binding protein complex acid labile subunit isoform X2 [Cylas formicarius]
MANRWLRTTWLIIFIASIDRVIPEFSPVTSYDLMKCTYGERGSLTATCVNATPSFFKNTLYKFDHLDETLRCVNCTLKSIEPGTFDLNGNQIKHLDLRNSQIESMKQKAFMGLIFVETLDLSQNKIRSVFPATFIGVKKIASINLSHNDITILSENGFLELVNLKTLDVSWNQIEVLDEKAFNGLKSLERLDLSNNKITELRNAFENLTSLESINLRSNNIKTIRGEEFYNLTSLLEIDLSQNDISTPLLHMSPNAQLRSLNLAHNRIVLLSPTFLEIRSLEELDLSFNKITSIARKSFTNLFNLHSIDVSYNELCEIKTGSFTGLPQLRVLNCSHNAITDVVISGVFLLHSLHALDLSFNRISDLDYTALISRLPRLSYLQLEHNALACDLEAEMERYFLEDNFKFVLYSNIPGEPKCVDKPTTKHSHTALESVQAPASVTNSQIAIFIILSFLIVAVAGLFYLQYRIYRETKLGRAVSTVQLLATDSNNEEHVRIKI